MKVRAKKHLGQHFLKDEDVALRIIAAFTGHEKPALLLEIGPGTGVLTRHLIHKNDIDFLAADVDTESIAYLKERFPEQADQFVLQDFLQWDGSGVEKLGIIGNFPYNISSQIFFHILEMKPKVTEVVCMLQKEVAQRIASGPGSKAYGILSVLLQCQYRISYLFTVPPDVFEPPPKVQSGVIRIEWMTDKTLPCRFSSLQRVVKQAFNMRRKTLRNALKPIGLPKNPEIQSWLDRRAEELTVADFEQLALAYENEGLIRIKKLEK